MPTLDELRTQRDSFIRAGVRREARPTHLLAGNGKTCRTCRHALRISYAKGFYKCNLVRDRWTHGTGTDIRLKDPACSFYDEKDS
jgi:hypothetical protein